MLKPTWSLSLLAALGLVSACGAAPPPPSDSPVASPASATAKGATTAAALASSTAPDDPVAAPELVVPPPLAEPLPPLTGGFTPVKFPGVKAPIRSISGKGEKDMWIVAAEVFNFGERREYGAVFHADGKGLKNYGHPCEIVNTFEIAASESGVVTTGYRGWSRGVAPMFRVPLTKEGKWKCDYADPGFNMGFTVASGGQVWQLDCHHASCLAGTAFGPPLPLPSHHESFGSERPQDAPPLAGAFFMQSLSHGYLVYQGEDGHPWIFHYNGVAWSKEVQLSGNYDFVSSLVDEDGTFWLLVRTAAGNVPDETPADKVLRYDGRSLAMLPVPAKFGATAMCATHAHEVFLVGSGSKVYEWDGRALRQGQASFEPSGVFCSLEGTVLLYGGTKAKGDEDPDSEKPLAARLTPKPVAPAEVKP